MRHLQLGCALRIGAASEDTRGRASYKPNTDAVIVPIPPCGRDPHTAVLCEHDALLIGKINKNLMREVLRHFALLNHEQII